MAIQFVRDHFSLAPNILSLIKSIQSADCYQNSIQTDLRLFVTTHVNLKYLSVRMQHREAFLMLMEFAHILIKRRCIVTMILNRGEIRPLRG